MPTDKAAYKATIRYSDENGVQGWDAQFFVRANSMAEAEKVALDKSPNDFAMTVKHVTKLVLTDKAILE